MSASSLIREAFSDGGRLYWRDVIGRRGWMAKYFKEVDASESTLRFWQEIYNPEGILVEVHHKYPEDRGHELLEN